jgi:hypothetical protein
LDESVTSENFEPARSRRASIGGVIIVSWRVAIERCTLWWEEKGRLTRVAPGHPQRVIDASVFAQLATAS